MRLALLLLVLGSGCGSFVRNDSLAGPIYDACMERKMANRSDREADEECVYHARWKARSIMDEGTTTTVCHDFSETTTVCKSRSN